MLFIYSGKWCISKMIRTVIKQQDQIHRYAQHKEGGSQRNRVEQS